MLAKKKNKIKIKNIGTLKKNLGQGQTSWPGARRGEGAGHTNPLKKAHEAAEERRAAWWAVRAGLKEGAEATQEQAEIRRETGHRNRGVRTAHETKAGRQRPGE